MRDELLLFLLSHGETKLSRLCKELNSEKDELLSLLRPMELEGLIKKESKGIFRKDIYYSLTEKGLFEARKIKDST
ncbi:MAG: winged helix DNA-binding protein [Metallosphaera sp.]|nr:winged helix DNA-binding protein [Metallosphaera cuprina]